MSRSSPGGASARARAATAAGSRGASGRITSSAVAICGCRVASSARSRIARPGLEVLVRELRARSHAGRDEPATRREERIPLEVRADLGPGPVGGLEVGARVAQVAHRSQVEDGRVPMLANPRRELLRGREERRRVVALGPLDGELGPAVERLLDPPLGSRHADPEAVVLAHEQERQRLPAVGEVRRRVQRGLRRRVVQGRVSERADDDGVERPFAGDAELACALDREGDARRRAAGATRSSTSAG